MTAQHIKEKQKKEETQTPQIKEQKVPEQNAKKLSPDETLAYLAQKNVDMQITKKPSFGVNPFTFLDEERIGSIQAAMPEFEKMYEANLAAINREFGTLLSDDAKSELALKQIN